VLAGAGLDMALWRHATVIILVQIGAITLAEEKDPDALTSVGGEMKDLTEEIDMADTCESCLKKGGGWCTSDQRCGEDDIAHCDVDHLIGLAGFSNDCKADEEGRKPKTRKWLDKGVLVSYPFENGTCCQGTGIIHRAYHVLEEYTVLLREGSKEELKTDRWNARKPAKKKDEGSEYHDMEFRYFRPDQISVISGIRPGDLVQAHFAVKQKGGQNLAEDAPLVKSQRTELAVVVNVTVANIGVNFTSDLIVSIVPRDFVVDTTNETRKPTHEEL
jgi:hypothetical protein